MFRENPYPLSVYQELEPLCEKGHVVLVQNNQDGQLYVKKRIQTYSPELYRQLRADPVKNTPVLHGIFEDPAASEVPPGAHGRILIEEYLPGHTLAECLQEDGLFSQERCIDIAMQICSVLMDLHGRKPAIIHRDIKPSNVMLLPDGTVRLIDFSAAKTRSAHESRDTVLIGTAGFAAPEQYGFSASTPQTDLYALGVLMNTMLTGSLPWERQVQGHLRNIIARCLMMDPKRRYAGAWELYAALKNARKQKVPWLPPGFRTLRWYKMIPAMLWYIVVIYVSFQVDLDPGKLFITWLCTCMSLLLLGLLPVFFYGNYLGIRRYFPFMRSSNRWVRMLGMVIAPVFLILLDILICMVPLIFVVLSGFVN